MYIYISIYLGILVEMAKWQEIHNTNNIWRLKRSNEQLLKKTWSLVCFPWHWARFVQVHSWRSMSMTPSRLVVVRQSRSSFSIRFHTHSTCSGVVLATPALLIFNDLGFIFYVLFWRPWTLFVNRSKWALHFYRIRETCYIIFQIRSDSVFCDFKPY